MSATAPAKIFGIRLGVDPKILVVGLIALAGVLFWYNSRADDETAGHGAPVSAVPAPAPVPVSPAKEHSPATRRRSTRDDRGTLRLRPIDATRGDVDPMLRLDLLQRLQNVQPVSAARNLFESGPGTAAGMQTGDLPVHKIMPQALPHAPEINGGNPPVTPVTANIPFKYFGFAKPSDVQEKDRGFFLDGDNILMAAEGDLLQKRYLVVQLTPASARLEDTQIKLGQTLPVVPEATEQ